MLQYAPHLKAAGWSVTHAPLLDDDYLSRLYNHQRTIAQISSAYVKRLGSLLRERHHALLWIEKELLPWVPWFLERLLRPANSRVVVDYDDAVFHNYDLHRSAIVRQLFGRKIDSVMRDADLVLAGNQYLAERANAAGARGVRIVPTVVDMTRYLDAGPPKSDAPIGWMGTPSTWKEYMAPMLPVLEEAATKFHRRIMVVGARATPHQSGLIDSFSWSEQTEASMISEMGIGLMPLNDTPWSRGKCGYKLIQYMASGIPVIASPVGVNAAIVEHGVNGFLAESDADWRSALQSLLADPDLRRRMGSAGRRKVQTHYSLQTWAPKVEELLASSLHAHGSE